MSTKTTAIFIAAFSAAVIASAWGFQVIGGYEPCGLCLQQRLPYYYGVPVAALAVLAASVAGWRRFVRPLLFVTAGIFAISLFLAARHAGVEWDLWDGPPCPSAGYTGIEGGKSLLDVIQNAKIGFCDEPPVRFLTLSFAGWNAIASLILMAAALYGALRGYALIGAGKTVSPNS
ncbi:MAG: disulfide bond formation protein B [Pseudomonadota bacterium]